MDKTEYSARLRGMQGIVIRPAISKAEKDPGWNKETLKLIIITLLGVVLGLGIVILTFLL